MRTHSDCRLALSYLPHFSYDARYGGGPGSATRLPSGRLSLDFDPAALVVPPLEAGTARLGGLLPLPPLLQVNIRPLALGGWLDPASGEIELQYDAQFSLSAPRYHPPPLLISTLLTTEAARMPGPGTGAGGGWWAAGAGRGLRGRRMDAAGRAVLVGLANVPRTGHWLTDLLLWLPAQATAVLSAEFEFSGCQEGWRPA